jgi:lactoylglutathione lyase
MSHPIVFQSVHPIGDTDVNALPSKEFGPAIGYYTQVLGFRLVERQEEKVILQRDNVQIGLAHNGNDPEQASCYFSVSDVEALYQELQEKGIEPSAVCLDEHEGKQYRIFFAKEPYGVCFCFGQPA